MTEPTAAVDAPATEQTDEEIAAELERLRSELVAAGWAAPDRPANVIQALARVMAELPGIAKGETSEQGYQYRGIESITREAQQLLGRYCVVFVPRVVSRVVKDLVINQRPWTEDQAEIVYTVYGPGGVEDRIEVGPLVALGRDNSDKGMNKAMTQAFKYALLQTLCIGDHKDDADADEAHVADAKSAPMDPEKQARYDLGARIRQLSPESRAAIRDFCDESSIPRVTAQMTDEQMEAVTEKVDALEIAAAQDAAAEASQDGEQEAEQTSLPVGDEPAAEETPAPAPEPQETLTPAEQWAKQVEAVKRSPDPVQALTSLIVAEVKALEPTDVIAQLGDREIAPQGNMVTQRKQLAEAIFAERAAEIGIGQDGGE